MRLGSLTGGLRTIYEARAGESYYPLRAAIGAGDAIAVITHREGAAEGAYRAKLLRPRHSPKLLLPTLALGDRHDGGLAIDHVSTDGRRVTIVRTFDEDVARFVFALPSGKRITGPAAASRFRGA